MSYPLRGMVIACGEWLFAYGKIKVNFLALLGDFSLINNKTSEPRLGRFYILVCILLVKQFFDEFIIACIKCGAPDKLALLCVGGIYPLGII